MRRRPLLLLLRLLLLCAAICAGALERRTPGPGVCSPECTKYGNCGDDGDCRCPFGRLGRGCEIDFLAPCRQGPGTGAYCGAVAVRSCECLRRCRDYFCRPNSANVTTCEGAVHQGRTCYMREGVKPEEQFSIVPEEDEAGVKYWASMEQEEEVEYSAAMSQGELHSLPTSQCPDNCSKHGYCLKWGADGQPYCSCYRGFSGDACKESDNLCYLQCYGRGTCQDQFCHCKPPYFSIGCSRSTVYPANYSVPSPAKFKIYMYELNTQRAYDNVPSVDFQGHDANYLAYSKFLEQFLLSPVRTEDPSEASLFYIPAFTYAYSGNIGDGMEHIGLLLDHVKSHWPYWNRTNGRDHFIWAPADRGACYLGGLASQLIRVTHFGYYHPNTSWGASPWDQILASKEYACHHPLRDVVAVPFEARGATFFSNTKAMTIDDIIASKKTLFFFAGSMAHGYPEVSGNARQILHNLTQEWNDPEFGVVVGGVDNYEETLRTSKFCLAPYGYGYGMRLLQAVITGCVPVIVQEHVQQPYEEVLPYELFSLRLDNADLPHIRQILRGVTDQQYRQLQENLVRYRDAFVWDTSVGGRAFEYTIAALRRRHLALKAVYY